MCGVLPCVAEVLNGCSRWQKSLFELLSADIPALVRSRQRQWWTGTVSVEHTGAFMQHLWETQWGLEESDLIMGKIISNHIRPRANTDTSTKWSVQTCPGGQVHPGVQGPCKHWVCDHRSSQVYGHEPEQSQLCWATSPIKKDFNKLGYSLNDRL